jgi:hypothetical protein
MVRELVRDVDPHAPPKAAFLGALPLAFQPPNCDFIMIGGGVGRRCLAAAVPSRGTVSQSLALKC